MERPQARQPRGSPPCRRGSRPYRLSLEGGELEKENGKKKLKRMKEVGRWRRPVSAGDHGGRQDQPGLHAEGDDTQGGAVRQLLDEPGAGQVRIGQVRLHLVTSFQKRRRRKGEVGE